MDNDNSKNALEHNSLEAQEEIKKHEKKKRIQWAVVGVTILILTNIFSFSFGTVSELYIPGIGVFAAKLTGAQPEYAEKKSNEISKASDRSAFDKLFGIRELIYRYYDGPIDDEKLLEGAIKGMTDSLNDPYTVFMNQKEYKDFSQKSEGNYVGAGFQVGINKEDKVQIISVFENSPAEKSGIKADDILLKVNDLDVSGKTMENAISIIKNGKAKEKVNVTLFRQNKGVFSVDVIRDVIVLSNVKGEMVDNSIGYIRLSDFIDMHTGENFNKKLNELKSKGMKGLVIDLRQNPGGLLSASIDVASNFIPKDKIITYTVDKYGNRRDYKSNGGNFIGMPVVIIVDGNSASASEVFSGALRDYEAATLVGTTTFGKGIVQNVIDIKDETALKVTISKYYTPNGENIHKIGIKPNVEVKISEDLIKNGFTRQTDPQFNKALEVIKEKIK